MATSNLLYINELQESWVKIKLSNLNVFIVYIHEENQYNAVTI